MNEMTRRDFFKALVASALAAGAVLPVGLPVDFELMDNRDDFMPGDWYVQLGSVRTFQFDGDDWVEVAPAYMAIRAS